VNDETLARLVGVEEKASTLESRVADLSERMADIENYGAGTNEEEVRRIFSDEMKKVEVHIHIKPAGQKLNVLGQSADLSHDHGTEASVKFAGVEVARSATRQIVSDTERVIDRE
jgi:hypothetical protein